MEISAGRAGGSSSGNIPRARTRTWQQTFDMM